MFSHFYYRHFAPFYLGSYKWLAYNVSGQFQTSCSIPCLKNSARQGVYGRSENTTGNNIETIDSPASPFPRCPSLSRSWSCTQDSNVHKRGDRTRVSWYHKPVPKPVCGKIFGLGGRHSRLPASVFVRPLRLPDSTWHRISEKQHLIERSRVYVNF